MTIRKATIQDVAGIAKVHVDSWRSTYDNIIPEKYLMDLSYEQHEVKWEKIISEGLAEVFIAEEDGKIVGFVSDRKDKDKRVLGAIYILDDYQGQGIGNALMKEIFHYFSQENLEKVYVEVLADNTAKAFYEHYGAKYVGEEFITIGGKALKEFIYVWDDVSTVAKQLA